MTGRPHSVLLDSRHAYNCVWLRGSDVALPILPCSGVNGSVKGRFVRYVCALRATLRGFDVLYVINRC